MDRDDTADQKSSSGDLVKAWGILVVLTLAGYGLSLINTVLLAYMGPVVIAALILFKTRIILRSYLGLTRCPAWLSLLSTMITAITVVCAGLLMVVIYGNLH